MRKIFLCAALILLFSAAAVISPANNYASTASAAEEMNTEASGSYAYLYGNPRGKYYKMKPTSEEETAWNYSAEDEWAVAYVGNGYTNLHPGNRGDVMQGWQSPGNGEATVTGEVEFNNPNLIGTDPAINGIRFSLLLRKKTADGYATAQPLADIDNVLIDTVEKVVFNVNVPNIGSGDVILAAVNNNGNNNSDGNSVSFSVSYTGTIEEDAPDDFGCGELPIPAFSYTQGENGWYYAYGLPQKYILMDIGLNYAGYVWTGPKPYQFVSSGTVHPNGKWSTLKIWIASFDGEIEIDGMFVRNANEGDGTNVDVYHNGERIWWEQCDYIGSKTYNMEPIRRTVKKGDAIVFSFSAGARLDNRADGINAATNIYILSGEPDDEFDTSAYLQTAKNEAEIVGVRERTATPKESGLNVGALVGGLVGGAVLVAGAVVVAIVLMKRRKRG